MIWLANIPIKSVNRWEYRMMLVSMLFDEEWFDSLHMCISLYLYLSLATHHKSIILPTRSFVKDFMILLIDLS